MKILVVNIGSTSLKYRLFAGDANEPIAEGQAERIGGASGGAGSSYESAIAGCLDALVGSGKPLAKLEELSAVAFKAVHAGPLGGTRLVDERLLQAMQEFTFFAPAHNPPYMAAMRAFQKTVPAVPLVAVFETAFFTELDEATVTYAVPYEWKQKYGIRRYGFHGASHRAASEHVQQMLGRNDLRHISCHLGGSSSMAAIRNGVAIDTTFGISPQSGLPQNNRCGDLDVFAALFMMQKLSLSVEEMGRILGSQSGLLGMSGRSADVRDLSEAAANGDARSRLALDVLVRAVRHYLGAFAVALGGVDVLSFSGGIGENSPELREKICAGLEWLGLELDPESNRAALRREARLSRPAAPVQIVVLPANEERIVARAAAELLSQQAARA